MDISSWIKGYKDSQYLRGSLYVINNANIPFAFAEFLCWLSCQMSIQVRHTTSEFTIIYEAGNNGHIKRIIVSWNNCNKEGCLAVPNNLSISAAEELIANQCLQPTRGTPRNDPIPLKVLEQAFINVDGNTVAKNKSMIKAILTETYSDFSVAN